MLVLAPLVARASPLIGIVAGAVAAVATLVGAFEEFGDTTVELAPEASPRDAACALAPTPNAVLVLAVEDEDERDTLSSVAVGAPAAVATVRAMECAAAIPRPFARAKDARVLALAFD